MQELTNEWPQVQGAPSTNVVLVPDANSVGTGNSRSTSRAVTQKRCEVHVVHIRMGCREGREGVGRVAINRLDRRVLTNRSVARRAWRTRPRVPRTLKSVHGQIWSISEKYYLRASRGGKLLQLA